MTTSDSFTDTSEPFEDEYDDKEETDPERLIVSSFLLKRYDTILLTSLLY